MSGLRHVTSDWGDISEEDWKEKHFTLQNRFRPISSYSATAAIRLIFDEPLKIKHIWLVFEDAENTRTQEFVLRRSADTTHSFREIARQQWNFCPPQRSTGDRGLCGRNPGVKVLELVIVANVKNGAARASLKNLRLA
jgi:hypothetical protein